MSTCRISLPYDVIVEILESTVWWPRDLYRLSLVSTSWLFYTRKLLYSKPALASFPACVHFARTVQTNPRLISTFVKGIELCPTWADRDVASRRYGAEEMHAIRIILGLNGLRTLVLGGEMSVCAERFLHCLIYSHDVEELTIDGSLIAHSLSTRPSLEWDEVIACKLASVQKLRFVRIELEVLPVLTHGSPYRFHQLTELVVDNVEVISGNLPWLLQDTTTLKHLWVSGDSSSEVDEHVRLVLESYNIESLHYQVSTFSWNLTLFEDDFASPHSLRSLHLDGVRIDSEILRMIHARCPAMEQLYISGRYVPLTREDWIGCIASGLFPALRRLGLPEGTFCPPLTFTKWTASLEPALQKACSRRGVRLLC
ncbi:hypothetical protein BDP27DRAFT_1327804 [Rhodocollybia butyracea]|uniref:F-box domain-containing protein n=1 Tax=Rhodocollybia butyracea TaxID=206335 RepID=A0A9P5U5P5_9AGAR|nr:hypothetical protein BDP27DRAFT_1327804 [Rhodocollybia butyracea]